MTLPSSGSLVLVVGVSSALRSLMSSFTLRRPLSVLDGTDLIRSRPHGLP
jgi:hypothetical protein